MNYVGQPFTTQERLENVDIMVFQYLDVIMDLMDKIMSMLELRDQLKTELND